MKLEKSKTKENLMTAFLRESGAYLEYTFYAEQAKQQGYEDVYNLYNQFANNEKAHAKIWFKLFHGIGGVEENLSDSADLEHFERTVLYSEFAKVAESEGFKDISFKLNEVAKIEQAHEKEYKNVQKKISSDKFFCDNKQTAYKCLNCGHVYYGECAPDKCPVCSYPKAYFKKQTNG